MQQNRNTWLETGPAVPRAGNREQKFTLETAALLTRTNEPDAGEIETGETIEINEWMAEKELNVNPCCDRKD
jgi:hypothetical protein